MIDHSFDGSVVILNIADLYLVSLVSGDAKVERRPRIDLALMYPFNNED